MPDEQHPLPGEDGSEARPANEKYDPSELVATPQEYLRAARVPAPVPVSEQAYFWSNARRFALIGAALVVVALAAWWISLQAQAPEKGRAMFREAADLVRQQHYGDAVMRANQGFALNNSVPEAYKTRGIAYLNLGDNEKAVADLTTYLNSFPADIDAVYSRGVASQKLQHYDAAIPDFTKVIASQARPAAAYSLRGSCQRALHHDDAAIADFTKAIELELTPSNNIDNYYQRGSAYESLGQREKALDDYTKAIEFSSERPFVYLARGRLRKALGDNKGGDQDLATAKQIEERLFH